MKSDWKDLLKRFHKAHATIYTALQAEELPVLKLEQMVDLKQMISEIEDLADSIRKECASTGEVISMLFCANWTMQAMQGERAEKIVGEYATGTADLGGVASVPKRDTPQWSQLMDTLGVPVESRRFVSIHWPSMSEHVAEAAAEGKPVMKGLDPSLQKTKYHLRTRKNGKK